MQTVGETTPLVELQGVSKCFFRELDLAAKSGAVVIGVNNRDLNTFDVDVRTSFDIARRIEGCDDYVLVSESGITDPILIAELREAGFSAFLIGTAFLDSSDPGQRLRGLLDKE